MFFVKSSRRYKNSSKQITNFVSQNMQSKSVDKMSSTFAPTGIIFNKQLLYLFQRVRVSSSKKSQLLFTTYAQYVYYLLSIYMVLENVQTALMILLLKYFLKQFGQESIKAQIYLTITITKSHRTVEYTSTSTQVLVYVLM